MIPQKLGLRNFMCYRGSIIPLSFDGIHVACLCGDNGNGKSALLDAMTWAVWGESRARSADDLIHQGQAEMEVDFEFGDGGQSYRVIRKHSKGQKSRSGSTVLAFQMRSDSAWKDISGNSATETQHKIIDTLRLDYDTFINSAFLVQGRANEFTLKQPSKRKEVLANILGLSLYDSLEERAKNAAAKCAGEAARLQSSILELDAELANRLAYQADLVQFQASLSQVEAALKQKETDLALLQSQEKVLEMKRDQLKDTAARSAELKADLDRWSNKVAVLGREISTQQELEAGRPGIEQGYAQFVRLDAEKKKLDEKAHVLITLNERIAALDKTVERAQGALIGDHKVAQARLSERRSKASALPGLESTHSAAQTQLRALADRDKTLLEKRQRLQDMLVTISQLKSDNQQLIIDVARLDDKLKLLGEDEAKCPLCESDLGANGLRRVRESYTGERTQKARTVSTNKQSLEKLVVERRSLEAETDRLEAALKTERTALQARLARLDTEISNGREAVEGVAADAELVQEIEDRLAHKQYAQAEQRALAELTAQVNLLGYDARRHQEIFRDIAGVTDFQQKWKALEDAGKRLPQARAELEQASAAREETLLRIQVAEQKRLQLERDAAGLRAISDQVREARTLCETLRGEERHWREKVITARAGLDRMAKAQSDKDARKKSLALAKEQEEAYRLLAEAFGKKGIQALLIDQAIPEIEMEADRLLKRLTDNRMSISMETQRETKKGSVLETLDILIADDLGTRAYEMFSGGEAFRIDFALRIALSRLLTRRAGASLSTLFIDEGFGTQDAAGREKLVDVIKSVQDDFERIVVITHLEEIKEAFPVRIEVTKTPEGSSITVN